MNRLGDAANSNERVFISMNENAKNDPMALSLLDQAEQTKLVIVLWALMQVRTLDQFRIWTQNELQFLLPHGALICGVGYIDKPAVQMIDYLSINFPMAYMDDIRLPDGSVLSPIMDRWLKEKTPQLFDPSQSEQEVPQEWLSIFNKHDLRNIAGHGMYCNNKPISSYFSFSRIPEPLGPRHAYLLEFLVPQMHSVLTRILLNKQQVLQKAPAENLSRHAMLTTREREILILVGAGKTNVEIAELLFVSKETIKSHVKKILFKLNAKSRTEVVKLAGEMGYFHQLIRPEEFTFSMRTEF